MKDTFKDQPIYRRIGIINAYEDPRFRKALEELVAKTGRKHITISGLALGTCVTLRPRMSAAGAQLNTVYALGAELQADWKLPSGNDMLPPFINGLPEYGWIVQQFWNNADPAKRPVKDPFGLVK